MPEYTQSDKKTAYRLYRKGWGYLKISDIIGCSPTTVRDWILDKGIKPRKVSGHPESLKKKVIKYYVEHPELSMEKVAIKHEVGAATLATWLKDAEVTVRPYRPRIVDQEGVLKDLKAGLPKKEIATRNSCSESWVYTVQRKRWRMSNSKLAPIYYFGCQSKSKPGHYLFSPDSMRRGIALYHDDFPELPWEYNYLDTGLCPNGDGHKWVDGLYKQTYKSGWTSWAFWDRTGDNRAGSHSTFIAPGNHSADKMMELVQEHFPEIMKRVNASLELREARAR